MIIISCRAYQRRTNILHINIIYTYSFKISHNYSYYNSLNAKFDTKFKNLKRKFDIFVPPDVTFAAALASYSREFSKNRHFKTKLKHQNYGMDNRTFSTNSRRSCSANLYRVDNLSHSRKQRQ